MPNIKQQEKRVRLAARQRLQNLRFRSTVKTYQRRLESAVADGDATKVEAEHRELVRWIDRAAAGARSTATRPAARRPRPRGSPPGAATPPRATRGPLPAPRPAA